MGSVRQYDFVSTGVETGTQPDASAPVGDGDLIDLEYLQDNYMPGSAISINLSETGTHDLTGVSVDHTVYMGAKFEYVLERKTSTGAAHQFGTIYLAYNSFSSAWRITYESRFENTDLDLVFSMSSDQVRYTIPAAVSGTYVSSNCRGFLTKYPITF